MKSIRLKSKSYTAYSLKCLTCLYKLYSLDLLNEIDYNAFNIEFFNQLKLYIFRCSKFVPSYTIMLYVYD